MIPHTPSRFYGNSLNAQAITTLAVTANVLYAIPIYIPQTVAYLSIGIEVTTLATGNARLGIYEDAGGKPGALVLDAGTVSTTTTGYKTITISQTLTGDRWYWLAVVCDATPTLRVTGNTTALPWLGFTSGTDTVLHVGYSGTFTYAALPSDFDTGVGSEALMTGPAPKVMIGF